MTVNDLVSCKEYIMVILPMFLENSSFTNEKIKLIVKMLYLLFKRRCFAANLYHLFLVD